MNSTMGGKEVIFILGMARSGTSALTRVLSLCGCTLPGSLKEGNQGNPRGYWESLEVEKLSNEFFLSHDTTYSDPTLRLQGELSFTQQETEHYVGQICAFLSRCPQGSPLLIKDPRITALFDFWLQAAQALEFRVKVIVAVRHPMEVAASLGEWAARATTPASLELRQAMWLKYNLLAEWHSRRLPRVFTEYSNLLQDWRLQIARISRALSLDLSTDAAAAVDAFLSPDLHRQKCPGPITEAFGYPWVSDTYAILAQAARDQSFDVARLDEIFRAYRTCERAFRISLDDWRCRLPSRAPHESSPSAPS
jgi:hypothetical protein